MKKALFTVFAAIAIVSGVAAFASLFATVYTIFQGDGLLPVYFFAILFCSVLSMAFSAMAEGFAE
jgi:hypothetical protein